MGPMKALARALPALLLASGCSLAGAQVPAEVTARNASAGYVLSSLATLAMLRDECEPLLGQGADGAAAIAQAWWDRRRPDIELAYVWTDRYLQVLRATDRARHDKVARSVATDTREVVRRNAAGFFAGQLPTADSCRAALQAFAADAGDERFAEAVRALGRMRQEPGFAVPAHITLDPARSLHYGLAASLLAAQAAVQRRDEEGVRKAYGWMAQRGDARAAYQLGAMYMRGEVVGKDDPQAYRWFHKAWMLREAEGVNALGVMHRDGRSVPANQRLALALFQLAAVQASEPRSKARAERNLALQAKRMTPEERHATACMTLRQVADGVDAPLPPAERGSARIMDSEEARRLGDFLPQVSGGVPIFCG